MLQSKGDSSRASCTERFGRNPKLHGSMSASKTGSNTIFNAACTTRSRTDAIANDRHAPG